MHTFVRLRSSSRSTHKSEASELWHHSSQCEVKFTQITSKQTLQVDLREEQVSPPRTGRNGSKGKELKHLRSNLVGCTLNVQCCETVTVESSMSLASDSSIVTLPLFILFLQERGPLFARRETAGLGTNCAMCERRRGLLRRMT